MTEPTTSPEWFCDEAVWFPMWKLDSAPRVSAADTPSVCRDDGVTEIRGVSVTPTCVGCTTGGRVTGPFSIDGIHESRCSGENSTSSWWRPGSPGRRNASGTSTVARWSCTARLIATPSVRTVPIVVSGSIRGASPPGAAGRVWSGGGCGRSGSEDRKAAGTRCRSVNGADVGPRMVSPSRATVSARRPVCPMIAVGPS